MVKDITQEDVDKEREKIAASKAKLKEFRERIEKANPPKLKVVSIKRTINPIGILQGEQCVVVEFGEEGKLMQCTEINDTVRERSGIGCRIIFMKGNLLEQDKREAMSLMDYFPEYYVTVESNGVTLINEFRPNYGHMIVNYADTTIMKTVLKSMSTPDELVFKVGTEAEYDEFLKFYKKHGIKLSKANVKIILIPKMDSELIYKLQKFIVKDDLRVRYSFPIDELI